ncbi:hypothetical protein B0T14DRAFT_166155 [Immersiella caudata]|uniref:Uncharacterized protein n=1 Tax=Immersiella caudata TaxID=314043 RepID=A0AA39WWY1_9PEZI|nr:hypothetical protein B0T14DRAFT_166155 [Immersiella caudata]
MCFPLASVWVVMHPTAQPPGSFPRVRASSRSACLVTLMLSHTTVWPALLHSLTEVFSPPTPRGQQNNKTRANDLLSGRQSLGFVLDSSKQLPFRRHNSRPGGLLVVPVSSKPPYLQSGYHNESCSSPSLQTAASGAQRSNYTRMGERTVPLAKNELSTRTIACAIPGAFITGGTLGAAQKFLIRAYHQVWSSPNTAAREQIFSHQLWPSFENESRTRD